MTRVTQLLLLFAYAILGVSVAFALPLVGIETGTALVLGSISFVFAWQIQISFFAKKNEMDAIDMHRIDEIEKLAIQLKRDVSDLQETVDEQNEKGDEKDKKLVQELKTLQEFLIQVMQKETKGKKTPNKTAPAPAVDTDDSQMTAKEIEELGLAPEEAALIVVDEEEVNAQSEEEIIKALDEENSDEVDGFDDDEDLNLDDIADEYKDDFADLGPAPEPKKKTSAPAKTSAAKASTPKTAAVKTPAPTPAPVPAARADTPEPDPARRVQTHAQRRAAAAKKTCAYSPD